MYIKSGYAFLLPIILWNIVTFVAIITYLHKNTDMTPGKIMLILSGCNRRSHPSSDLVWVMDYARK